MFSLIHFFNNISTTYWHFNNKIWFIYIFYQIRKHLFFQIYITIIF